jgi:hypothetical protein
MIAVPRIQNSQSLMCAHNTAVVAVILLARKRRTEEEEEECVGASATSKLLRLLHTPTTY